MAKTVSHGQVQSPQFSQRPVRWLVYFPVSGPDERIPDDACKPNPEKKNENKNVDFFFYYRLKYFQVIHMGYKNPKINI